MLWGIIKIIQIANFINTWDSFFILTLYAKIKKNPTYDRHVHFHWRRPSINRRQLHISHCRGHLCPRVATCKQILYLYFIASIVNVKCNRISKRVVDAPIYIMVEGFYGRTKQKIVYVLFITTFKTSTYMHICKGRPCSH